VFFLSNQELLMLAKPPSQATPPTLARPARWTTTLLCTALLSACGGGGGDDDSTAVDTNTSEAANATEIGSGATDALDTSVMTAQAVVTTEAAASAAATGTTAQALSASTSGQAQPAAVASVPVTCPGGGSATLTITGGTPASVLNGTLDSGEVYQITFNACRRAAGVAAVTGTMGMTVQSATADAMGLDLSTTALAVTLPRGDATLNGNSTVLLARSTDANGVVTQSSQWTSPSITLATQLNARSSTFTLSAVAITRQSTWLGDALQSSSLNGTHTLSATLVNGSFSYTVATQGTVSYTADGLPSAGTWAVTLPTRQLGITVANGTATLTTDLGKDGTIDRTVTVPVNQLAAEAG